MTTAGNTVSETLPVYAEFEHALVPSPQWKPTALVPALPAPADPIERLLWVVSDEVAPAHPWFPTVDEQDADWWKHSARTSNHAPDTRRARAPSQPLSAADTQ